MLNQMSTFQLQWENKGVVLVLSYMLPKSFQAWQWRGAPRDTACESLTLGNKVLNDLLHFQSSCLVRVEMSVETQLPVKGGGTELALEHLPPLTFLCSSTFLILMSVCHVVQYDLVSLGHDLKQKYIIFLSQQYIMVEAQGQTTGTKCGDLKSCTVIKLVIVWCCKLDLGAVGRLGEAGPIVVVVVNSLIHSQWAKYSFMSISFWRSVALA